jgi:hypothetical protein
MQEVARSTYARKLKCFWALLLHGAIWMPLPFYRSGRAELTMDPHLQCLWLKVVVLDCEVSTRLPPHWPSEMQVTVARKSTDHMNA